MQNARILYINNLKTAKEEVRKVNVDADGIHWIAQKAVHICMKLENLNAYAANVIKQEMLEEGGDVAISRGIAESSVSKSDILIMGTLSQYNRLIYKIRVQVPVLQRIADEIEKLLIVVEKGKPQYFKCGNHKLPIGEKTIIMGILNITPDSFSDGNTYGDIESAIKRAKQMVEEGANIIDIGGESTRPGYNPVDAITEINRVIPLIEKLATEIQVPISVDTSKAIVAKKSLQAGAQIINDVWGLQKDPNMAKVIAESGAGVVMMHNQDDEKYNDVMGDIIKFLKQSIEIACGSGINIENMIIDPGIGFGKSLENNLEVMRRLKELDTLNLPVLLGTSRKSLIGSVLDLPTSERLEGTAATITMGISNGVDIVRVHDVREMARVARMTDAMVRA